MPQPIPPSPPRPPPTGALPPKRKPRAAKKKTAALDGRDDLREAKAGCAACAAKQRHPFRRVRKRR